MKCDHSKYEIIQKQLWQKNFGYFVWCKLCGAYTEIIDGGHELKLALTPETLEWHLPLRETAIEIEE